GTVQDDTNTSAARCAANLFALFQTLEYPQSSHLSWRASYIFARYVDAVYGASLGCLANQSFNPRPWRQRHARNAALSLTRPVDQRMGRSIGSPSPFNRHPDHLDVVGGDPGNGRTDGCSTVMACSPAGLVARHRQCSGYADSTSIHWRTFG